MSKPNPIPPVAHVRQLPDESWAPPHSLEEHLTGTARLAGQFAAVFNSENWGRLIGLAHDIGKSSAQWQQYLFAKSGFEREAAHLEGNPHIIEHADTSAIHAQEIHAQDNFKESIGRVLAYCISGHHTGLSDWYKTERSSGSSLQQRLKKEPAEVADTWLQPLRELDDLVPPFPMDPPLALSLWIRMLFSCLVDADFLDTEAYMDPDKAFERTGYSTIEKLLDRFNAYMQHKTAQAPDTPVNRIRASVLADCREAGLKESGIYSLTVPTGGGKTLSSLAFGLTHARKWGKRRIIYVIPYTSIVEQNADVFRQVLGTDEVIEHHSAIGEDNSRPRSRLAAENWDAPIIVTTSVQFFESLFAARTSRCRKLHNIANSVVVLDEAQLVPSGFLDPILQTMNLLSRNYGVTFVIATATQPAFAERGLDAPIEIIKDVPHLYAQLERVKINFPQDMKTPVPLEELAASLCGHSRVLCVVSDRKTCRELHALMPSETFHLSALMCGQHRSDVIGDIHESLRGDGPVRVISTQLVEAGVDLDFPVVYRALAGLDSIAQAAGRCNREGRLEDKGIVNVVITPRTSPPGILRKAADITKEQVLNGTANPQSPESFWHFFGFLYAKVNSLDAHGIIDLLNKDMRSFQMQFRTAADQFKLIDDKGQRSILVPYGKGYRWIEKLKKAGPSRDLMRRLQRYSVNIYERDFHAMHARGSILEMPLAPGVFVLDNDVEYSQRIGLLVNEAPDAPDAFFC